MESESGNQNDNTTKEFVKNYCQKIVDGLAAVSHGSYQGSTQALDKVELVL